MKTRHGELDRAHGQATRGCTEGSRKTKPTYQAVAIHEIMEVEKIIGGMHEPGRGQGHGGASGDESVGDEASSEDDDKEDEGEWPSDVGRSRECVLWLIRFIISHAWTRCQSVNRNKQNSEYT